MSESLQLSGNWNYPTVIRFGSGRIAELADACKTLGMQRPLLVTDAGLGNAAMVRDALQACNDAGLSCALFHDVQGNPVAANVDAGVAVYKSGSHDFKISVVNLISF